jgi:hypothetical protein
METQKLEALADFFCNGFEHGSDAEAVQYLYEEFSLTTHQAQRLIDDWKRSKWARSPTAPTAELVKFFKNNAAVSG